MLLWRCAPRNDPHTCHCERPKGVGQPIGLSLRATEGSAAISSVQCLSWYEIASSFHSSQRQKGGDCFVVSLLAQTKRGRLLRRCDPCKDKKGGRLLLWRCAPRNDPHTCHCEDRRECGNPQARHCERPKGARQSRSCSAFHAMRLLRRFTPRKDRKGTIASSFHSLQRQKGGDCSGAVAPRKDKEGRVRRSKNTRRIIIILDIGAFCC